MRDFTLSYTYDFNIRKYYYYCWRVVRVLVYINITKCLDMFTGKFNFILIDTIYEPTGSSAN